MASPDPNGCPRCGRVGCGYGEDQHAHPAQRIGFLPCAPLDWRALYFAERDALAALRAECRAHEEGVEAANAGAPCAPPYDDQRGIAWRAGWHRQARILAAESAEARAVERADQFATALAASEFCRRGGK